ncbi:MAG TPA: GNAT family N-acetyltransferase, partial [Candidatus Limnocylindria bacterium]
MADLPPGFSARPVVPERDVDQILELCRAAAVAEHGSPDIDERMIRGAFQLPGMDPERDSLLVLDPDGRAAGTGMYHDGDTQHIAPYLFFRTQPEHAASPVPDALLDWGAGRAASNLHRAPAGARVALHADTAAVNAGIVAALERSGWHRDRVDWTMEIDLAAAEPLPQPLWPDGIMVRTADPAELERDARLLHQTEMESFSDHYGYTPVPFEEWWHFRSQFNVPEPDLWILAMDGDEVAGMALCASQRAGQPDLGWVSSLGVRRRWRRRGLALAILLHAFGLLAARGKPRVGLGVDSQSLTGAT